MDGKIVEKPSTVNRKQLAIMINGNWHQSAIVIEKI